jgi:hypothetical protein
MKKLSTAGSTSQWQNACLTKSQVHFPAPQNNKNNDDFNSKAKHTNTVAVFPSLYILKW